MDRRARPYTGLVIASATILVSTGVPPTAEQRDVARKAAGLMLTVALIGVVVVTCLALIVLGRMRRRMTDGTRVRRTRHVDAWAEAGRRAGSPPAEAFEGGAGGKRGSGESEGGSGEGASDAGAGGGGAGDGGGGGRGGGD